MRIAIIYHSQTGHTRKLAELMQSKLAAEGHDITMVEIKTNVPVNSGTFRQPMNFEITNLPELAGFDAYCVGGPVWAFGPSPVIYKAITVMGDLKKKAVLPFVTMGFPLAGMGGKSTLKHMNAAIANTNGSPLPGIIIPRMFHNVDILMEKATNQCIAYFVNKSASQYS